MGDGGRGRFVDQIAFGEPLDGERGVDWMRRVVRDGVREDPARAGSGLEAAVPQPPFR